MQHIAKLHPQWGALPSILQPSWSRDVICFLTVRAARWNISTQSWRTSTSQTWSTPNRVWSPWTGEHHDDCRSAKWSIIIKVKPCLGVAPHKTCISISVRSFIFHNLATSEGWGMQICISMLKGAKIMESKAPNLEERAPLSDVLYIPWSCYLWESMTQGCYLWGSRDVDLHLDAQG